MHVYEQRTGRWFAQDGTLLGTGWAGQGAGKNNPAMQNVAKTGPLPCGVYTIEQPHDDPHTGKYTMNLIPDPANEMFGRSAFRIHGIAESHPELSSEGCVVQIRTVREKIWSSGDRQVRVI